MRQVLWPKYLLGGMLNQGGGMGGAERGEGDSLAGGVPTMGQLRGIVGRWPDADAVLQGGMSEGLRDWDLWYVLLLGLTVHENLLGSFLLTIFQGTASLLPAPLLPPLDQCSRRPTLVRVQRRLRHDLDRRSRRDLPDQASRRQHVRGITTHNPAAYKTNIPLTAPSSNPSASSATRSSRSSSPRC